MLFLVGSVIPRNLDSKPRIQPRQQDARISAQGLGILISPQEPHLLIGLAQNIPQAGTDVEILVILQREQWGDVHDGSEDVEDRLGLVGGDAPALFDHLDGALADHEGGVRVGEGIESVEAEGGKRGWDGLVCYAGFRGESDFRGGFLSE